MRFIYSLIIGLALLLINLSFTSSTDCTLLQNKPALVGQTVTFTINCPSSGTQYVAWDFGTGAGFGSFKYSLTASYTYYTPGIYQVFARIQGEDIPLTVVQTIVTPITNPRPTHSSTIVMDTTRDIVWAVNPDNNSIASIDANSLKRIAEVPVGRNPRTVAIDKSGNVWVTNEDDATVSVISPAGATVKTISLPYASRPYGICFDPLAEYAYVTLQATGKLLKLDPSGGTIVKETQIGKCPRGIAVSSNGQRIFVTRFISPVNQGEITEVSAASMAVQRLIPLPFDNKEDFDDQGRGVPNYLTAVTISPDGSTAWVPSKKDNTARGLFRDSLPLTFDNTVRTIVSRIDLVSNKEDTTLRRDINDSELACAVEFSPYGNLAFIATQGNNKIHVLDVYTNARVGSITDTSLTPQGMVFNPDGTKLFVQNYMGRSVSVYNTEDIILSNGFTPVLLAGISTIINEKLPPDVLLGKRIFYNSQDPRMSKTGYISCGGCHLEGGSDERVWDFTDRGEGFRNTHSIRGRRGTGMGNVHWTANFDEIQDFENDIRNGFGGTGFMSDQVFNSGTISNPLGDKKAGLSKELDALAAYVASLDKVHPSPYRNPDGTLTQDGVAGKAVFAKLQCNKCHSGPDFTDRPQVGLFHDVGTILPSSGKRIGMPLTGFATPTLKGVWETAPYLHDGSAETLKEVFTQKNPKGLHGNTASLSGTELDQLVSYLLQLDELENPSSGVDELATNPANLKVFPNPSSDYIKLTYNPSSIQGKNHVSISTIYGQMVYADIVSPSHTGSSTTITIKHLPAGAYVVTLLEENRRSNYKFIIQKE